MAGSELEWVDSWGFGLKAFLWESKLTPWSSPGEWVRTERRQALERAGRGQAGVQSACILWPLVDYLGMVFLVVTAGGRQTQFHIITKYFLNRIATLIWQKFLFLIVIFFKIYNSDNNALDHFFLINFHRTSKKKKKLWFGKLGELWEILICFTFLDGTLVIAEDRNHTHACLTQYSFLFLICPPSCVKLEGSCVYSRASKVENTVYLQIINT